VSGRKWTEREKLLNRWLIQAQGNLENERKMNEKLREERDALREWVGAKFVWWTVLIDKSQTPSLTWLLRDTLRILQRVGWFAIPEPKP